MNDDSGAQPRSDEAGPEPAVDEPTMRVENSVTANVADTVIQAGRLDALHFHLSRPGSRAAWREVAVVCSQVIGSRRSPASYRRKPIQGVERPTRGRKLVVRDRELELLRMELGARHHVQVCGPRGAGKKALLAHAAAAGAVRDCEGVLWPLTAGNSPDDVIQDLLHKCFEITDTPVVDKRVALELLGGLRALVVLEDVDWPLDAVRELTNAMRGSVFVVASERDLSALMTSVSLPPLSNEDSLKLVTNAVGRTLTDDEVGLVAELDVDERMPGRLVQVASHINLAKAAGNVARDLSPASRELLTTAAIERLSRPACALLQTLALFDDLRWGTELLCAASGVAGRDTIKELVDRDLADRQRDRCQLLCQDDAVYVPPVTTKDRWERFVRVIEWVAADDTSPGQVAAEAEVIERLVGHALHAGVLDIALLLARVASVKLVRSTHWGAWGRVLDLGLRAAERAGCEEDRGYFRYAIAVRMATDGRGEEAARLLGAVISTARDLNDPHLVEQAYALSAQIEDQDDATHPVLVIGQAAARSSSAERVPLGAVRGLGIGEGTGLLTRTVLRIPLVAKVRDLCSQLLGRLTGMPAISQIAEFVQNNPAVVRIIGMFAALAVLAGATLTASSPLDPAAAAPPAVALPGQAPPTSSDASPIASSAPGGNGATGGGTTAGSQPTSIGNGTDHPVGAGRNGGGTGSPSPGGATQDPPPPSVMTWGFARDVNVQDAFGHARPLDASSASDNSEANGTYGPWRMRAGSTLYATATHVSTGMQQVRMPTVSTAGGMVKVTVYDTSAFVGTGQPGRSCQPLDWGQDGADEVIDVVCFDNAGNRADVPFSVLYVAGSGANPLTAGGSRGYVVDDQPSSSVFTPDWRHGLRAGTVTRTGVGHYTADLPGSGVVEVSATGDQPRRCAVAGRHGGSVDVACTAFDGSAADAPFTISYSVNQNLLDDSRKPVGDYVVAADAPGASAPAITTQWASGGATLDRTAPGKYKLHFANGYLPSTVHVTAVDQGNHCNAMFWNDYSRKDDTYVYVACFTPAGAYTDSGFELLYITARIY